MNNSDMPAMPQSGDDIEQWNDPTNPGAGTYFATGLTKREHFAGLAMQGIITLKGSDCRDTDITAVQCVRMADSLLAELDKSK
jgi:hypothetical protein